MFIFLSILLFSQISLAQNYRSNKDQLPKLELGVGLGAAFLPHYPGSDETHTLVLPFPAIVYRGEKIRSDEDGGLRGRFYYSDRFEINMSFGASLPVSSTDNDEREGMPSLDFILEFGAAFIYHFVPKSSQSPFKLSFSLPIRHAFSTDFSSVGNRGLVFAPFLYSFYELSNKLTLFAGITATYATDRLHEYLYGVDGRFATATRPKYDAKGGHVLNTYVLGLSYNFDDYSLWAGYSFNDAQTNANDESPLFVQSQSHSFGLALTWWFYSK